MKQQEIERAKYQRKPEEKQRGLEEKALEQDRMNATGDTKQNTSNRRCVKEKGLPSALCRQQALSAA